MGSRTKQFNGSFQGFLDEFANRHGGPGRGTTLQLVEMITETFPSFRDEIIYEGKTGMHITLRLFSE